MSVNVLMGLCSVLLVMIGICVSCVRCLSFVWLVVVIGCLMRFMLVLVSCVLV